MSGSRGSGGRAALVGLGVLALLFFELKAPGAQGSTPNPPPPPPPPPPSGSARYSIAVLGQTVRATFADPPPSDRAMWSPDVGEVAAVDGATLAHANGFRIALYPASGAQDVVERVQRALRERGVTWEEIDD